MSDAYVEQALQNTRRLRKQERAGERITAEKTSLRFHPRCEASEAMQRAFREATPADWKRYWEAY